METSFGWTGPGHQPQTGGPKTIPAHALADFMYRLTVDLRIRLSADGRREIAVLFTKHFGDYLTTMGNRFPDRDLWTDPQLAVLRDFAMMIADVAGGNMRAASLNEQDQSKGVPTPELDGPKVREVCLEIMKAPETEALCGRVVKQVKAALGDKLRTDICPDIVRGTSSR